MKIKEIKGWNKGVKITWEDANENEYIYLCQDLLLWKNEEGDSIRAEEYDLEEGEDFMPYKEHKKKEKYHLYNIKVDGDWMRTKYFINEKGFTTENTEIELYLNWNNLEKQKLENEFIEV